MMDLTDSFIAPLQDFFEQSRINHLVMPLQTSAHKYYDEEEIFRFEHQQRNQQEIMPQDQRQNEMIVNHGEVGQMGGEDNCHPIIDIASGDANHIDKLLAKEQEEDDLMKDIALAAPTKIEQKQTYSDSQEAIPTPALQSLITFLVQCPKSSIIQINEAISFRFPQFCRYGVVQVLMQKFSKLKKTKQQLIKYCMRKAFKFILQLPRNSHILDGDKKQKYSFSKCKNKYLKRVSQQKSMNNKFLQQIFSQDDFKRDYFIFLSHFEEIMIEDNQRKIAYLAELLTQQKEGKAKNAEMVKRLPWTKQILEKVMKISKELLKFAEEGHA